MNARCLIFCVFIAVSVFAAEKEEKPAGVFDKPIPEFRLSNGTTFRNVTLVRYEKEKVVLKTSAGQTSLSYSYFPEPMRARMIAERDVALALKGEADKVARAAIAEKAEKERLSAAETAAAIVERRQRVEDAISRKVLIVGMTTEEAVRSWGGPGKKNTSGGAYGSTEQWIYIRGQRVADRVYVYFRGGLLTSWQQSE